MLRGRARMTQRQLGASVGVSERAVQVWEAGLGFPSAPSLQRLIGVYLANGGLSVGRELEEAAALWLAASVEAPRFKTAFDPEGVTRVVAARLKPPRHTRVWPL